jgi:hypothetical protein
MTGTSRAALSNAISRIRRWTALNVLGRETGGLLAKFLQLGVGQVEDLLRLLDRPDHQQVAEVFDQVLAELAHAVADHVIPLDARQDRLGITAEDRCGDVGQKSWVHGADQGGNIFVRHGAVAEGQHLVESGQRIAHAAVSLAGDQRQGGVADGDVLLAGDLPQTGDDLGHGDPFEIEALAAGKDGDRKFVGFGGGKDELDVFRRLLQGLQQRIEGVGGEHVDFVDDDDLVAAVGGEVLDAVAQFADIFHAVIGGAVDLEDVGGGAFGDLDADRTDVAGLMGNALFAVEGLGQDAGRTGLADTPGAGE